MADGLQLLFGGPAASASKPTISTIRLLQSTQGAVIPIVYGSQRVAPNWLWAGDYGSGTDSGSKAAGKSGPGSTHYFIGAALALAHGPGLGVYSGQPLGVGRAWQVGGAGGGTQLITTYGVQHQWIPFGGLDGQAPWGYLVTHHPEAAFGYSAIFYVATPSWELGNSPQPPQISFEVYGMGMIEGLNVFAFGSANGDANVPNVFIDLWLNTEIGLGADSSLIGTSYQSGGNWVSSFPFFNTALSEWYTFVGAANLWFSPLIDRQQPAAKWVQDFLDITQSELIVTCEALYVRPYCTVPVTGQTWDMLFQSYTYTPNLTPIATATDDDYVVGPGEPPVTIERALPQDRYNEVKIEFVNRMNNYNVELLHTKLQDQIDLFTYRPAQVQRYHHITRQDVAMKTASMMLYKYTQDVNRYQFTLTQQWIWLDPMDIIAINDPASGLVNYPVRVMSVEEDEQLNLKVVAADLWTCAPDSFFTQPTVSRSGQDAGGGVVSPVNTPVIFEPPAALTNGLVQIYLAISDSSSNYGGCGIWVSYDGGASYSRAGAVMGTNPTGLLTAALASHAAGLDTTNTLSVNISRSTATLTSISATSAAALNNLSYVGGELLAFETATATGPGRYNLTTLYRGAYDTTPGSHGVGSQFAWLNVAGRGAPGLFILTLAAANVGQTLKFKFTPFNLEGQQEADISTVAAYPYTVAGTGLRPTPFAFNYSGVPGASATVSDAVTQSGLSLPIGLTGSQATAGVAATASTVFTIKVNGVAKGTVTFAASGTTGTFSFTSAVTLNPGDTISMVAPAVPDATLADIAITLEAA